MACDCYTSVSSRPSPSVARAVAFWVASAIDSYSCMSVWLSLKSRTAVAVLYVGARAVISCVCPFIQSVICDRSYRECNALTPRRV